MSALILGEGAAILIDTRMSPMARRSGAIVTPVGREGMTGIAGHITATDALGL
jgi:hypothetical protein